MLSYRYLKLTSSIVSRLPADVSDEVRPDGVYIGLKERWGWLKKLFR